MKSYVITIITIQSIGLLAILIRMAQNKYPLTQTKTLNEAAFEFLIGIGFILWGGVLLTL